MDELIELQAGSYMVIYFYLPVSTKSIRSRIQVLGKRWLGWAHSLDWFSNWRSVATWPR